MVSLGERRKRLTGRGGKVRLSLREGGPCFSVKGVVRGGGKALSLLQVGREK